MSESGSIVLRVAITGASGLIGARLRQHLAAAGHEVRVLVRRPVQAADEVQWDPSRGWVDVPKLAGVDAVVHLAGENIAAARWSKTVKERLVRSRVEGTQTIARAVAAMEPRPRVLISSSAVGYYGNRGEELLTEVNRPGTGFLAETCRQWEAATEPARAAGVRVVCLRTGVVLTAEGGALPKMVTPFKLGLGGVIGSGNQFVSWIAMEDLLRAIEFLLQAEGIAGPVNAVSPNPVRNREFVHTLGRVLGRPTLVPMPAMMVKMAFGEMGVETLLASTCVLPERLTQAGFAFRWPQLEECVRHELQA